MTTPVELSSLRGRIDEIDGRLVELLAKRRALALETLGVKSRYGLFAIDGRREAAVVARGARIARELGLEEELVRDIFWRTIELSKAGFARYAPSECGRLSEEGA
jgi:chorismate mutase